MTSMRNTPACAGKTTRRTIYYEKSKKHPPRARGRPPTGTRTQDPMKTPPACAGKTPLQAELMLVPEKHPRVRGEDVQPWDPDDDIPETPPRARGRPFLAAFAARSF